MKWIDCSFPNDLNKLSSSFERFKNLGQSNGWNIEFKYSSLADIPWKNLDSVENTQLIKVDLTTSAKLLPLVANHSAQVNLLSLFDYLIFEGAALWPRLYIFESIRKTIVHKAHSQNDSRRAFVTGSNLMSVVALSVLFSLGYKDLIWVGEDMSFISEKIKYLNDKLLGVNITPLENHKLTLENKPGPILINTQALSQTDDFFANLCYFNYLSQDGLVCDLSSESVNAPLLEECKNAEVQSISLSEVLESLEVSLLRHFNL